MTLSKSDIELKLRTMLTLPSRISLNNKNIEFKKGTDFSNSSKYGRLFFMPNDFESVISSMKNTQLATLVGMCLCVSVYVHMYTYYT